MPDVVPSPRARRRLALLACVLLACVVASATAQPAAFVEGPCPFVLTPQDQDEVRCGRVTVPLVRADPAAGTAELQVAIVASTSPDPAEPILYLEGGPGGSAVATVPFWWTTSRLREHADVIVVDQRGTGFSAPSLDCWETYLVGVSDPDGACRARLRREGVPLQAFGSDDAAADVVDLLDALGLTRVSLLGGSYGTRLALTALREHPQRFRALVLDGVYPPHVRHLERQADLGWSALTAVFDACRADAACDAAYPRLERQLIAAMVRRDADPLPVPGGPLDGASLYVTLVDLLYDGEAAAYLPALIDAAYRGDAPRWAALESAYAGGGYQPEAYLDEIEALAAWLVERPVGPELDAHLASLPAAERATLRARAEGLYDLEAEALYYAVECAEEVPFARGDVAARRVARLPAPLSFLLDDVAWMQAACASWAVPATAPRLRTPVTGDVPTLLLSGAFDPITPPALAEEAAVHLERSYAVVVPGLGHGTVDVDPCATAIALAFLDDPARAPDTSCLADRPAIPFVLP
jgi:pimeloyl-ACP methyl ester carboxylesterase